MHGPFHPASGVDRFSKSCLLETLIGFGLVCAVNFFIFPQDPGFSHAQPHPYFLIILPIAARYGFVGGLWAGGLGAGLFIFLSTMDIPDISWLELKQYEVWGRPLFFIILGLLIGEIRQINIRRYAELASERDDLATSVDNLKAQYEALRQAKQEIDGRIISQEHTLTTLYESAQSLRSLEEKDIYPSVLQLLRDYVSVEKAAIYMISDVGLKLESAIGDNDSPYPRIQSPKNGHLRRAIDTRETVCINEALTEKSQEGLPAICAPILNGENGKVLGLVVIDRLPFIKLNDDSVRMVSMVADWCGASLANAHLHQDTKAKLITSDIVEAYTSDYFTKRLNEEFQRSRRYKLPLSLLSIALPGFDAAQEEKDDVLVAFSLAAKEVLRNMDMLFLGSDSGRFSLLLPNTPIEGARIVAEKIYKKFNGLYPSERDVLGIGLSQFEEDFSQPEDMIRAADAGAMYA